MLKHILSSLNPTMKKIKVIIIGAGAAGIAASKRLLENGISDIIILEAKDRMGGRIHSVDFGDCVVDLGAQWCHGEKDNIVYDLVKDFELLGGSSHSYDEFIFYKSNGKAIQQDISDKFLKIAMDIWQDNESLKNCDSSVGEYCIKRYDEVIQEKLENNETATELLEYFHKFVLCFDAAPTWFDASAKGSACYQHCDGDGYLHWYNRGYKMILEVLMKKYPDSSHQLPIEDKLLFNKEVNKINWKNYCENVDQVQVCCTDSSSYIADHVLLTLPLGVLKQKYNDLFTPELPLYKINAINGLGFGTNVKVFLKFSYKWWNQDPKGFSLLWIKDDCQNISNEFPDGICIDGKSWLEDVLGFYPVDNDPNTLLAWIVGYHACEIEKLSKYIIQEGCLYLLNKFVGFKYNIPHPVDMVWSSWNSDPHFCGTYSYRSLKSDQLNVFAEDLAKPVAVNNKQVLLFAGEATHSYYYSTVHGAIESGFREADRIIKIYKSKWTSCPWVRGGYSHITPECDRTGTGPITLSEPVYDNGIPKILLAGEACNPANFSTTHGAFESGQKQAELILEFLK